MTKLKKDEQGRVIVKNLDEIPVFKTAAEEQAWWDTHTLDAALFENPKERPTHLPPPRSSKKSQSISLRVEKDVLERLKAVAKKKKMGYQTLLKAFLLERLYEEEKRVSLINAEANLVGVINNSASFVDKIDKELQKGYMDFLFDGREAVEEATEFLVNLAEDTINLGKQVTSHTTKISRLSIRKGKSSKTMKDIYGNVNSAAEDLNQYAEALNAHRFFEIIKRIIWNYSKLVSSIKQSKDTQDIEVYRESFATLSTPIQEAVESISTLRDSVGELITTNISMSLTNASQKVVVRLEKLIDSLKLLKNFIHELPIVLEKPDYEFKYKIMSSENHVFVVERSPDVSELEVVSFDDQVTYLKVA